MVAIFIHIREKDFHALLHQCSTYTAEFTNQKITEKVYLCDYMCKMLMNDHVLVYFAKVHTGAWFQEIVTGTGHSSAIDWWALGKNFMCLVCVYASEYSLLYSQVCWCLSCSFL